MEFIRFVLSGFWTWAGFLILIVAAGNAVAEIIKAACPCRKIEAYRTAGTCRSRARAAVTLPKL